MTELVRASGETTPGTLLLTSRHLSFFDRALPPSSELGSIDELLDSPKDMGGPLVRIPVLAVLTASRDSRRSHRNRLRISSTVGDFLFNDGWTSVQPMLRKVIVEGHLRSISELDVDSWSLNDQ